MKYAIQNENGTWWTGTCWGVKEARAKYTSDDLPLEIDNAHHDNKLEYDAEHGCYYNGYDDEPEASLTPVK